MTCDQYKNPLRLAAACNGKLDAEIARHVKRCSTCRMTLRSERELFLRIDSALRAQVNEDPRPGFLAQLRLRVSEESTARPGLDRVWHVAEAAWALVLLAMFYPLISARQSSFHENLQTPTIEVPSRSSGITQSGRAHEALGVQFRHHFKPPALHGAVSRQPEVLVPPDEQKAFAQFVACVARQDAIAQAVVTPAADNRVNRNTELPHVHSVDIADLQLHRGRQEEWISQTGSSE